MLQRDNNNNSINYGEKGKKPSSLKETHPLEMGPNRCGNI
jgi:hypothetical protein